MKKSLVIKQQDKLIIEEYKKEFNLSEASARILFNRVGNDLNDAKTFLYPSSTDLLSPFLLDGMETAVFRINLAIERKEIIVIYGDYDVDGITSVSLLYKYLLKRGALVDYYIPDRIEEGYGLNPAALKKISENGATLIITVDCGITAAAEIAEASLLGLDFIVTDHHESHCELPKCTAVINPKISERYNYKDLAGVGVAFKLLCAIEGNGSEEKILDEYGEIIAIGTVADVVSLLGENRIITSIGLNKLNNGRMGEGLRALIDLCNIGEKKITPSVIGYIIAPKINAAGRMGSTENAIKLFIENDKKNAYLLAEELCEENRQRQDVEMQLLQMALDMVEKSFDFKNDKIIVLEGFGWHHGIIGIISSKITDKYFLPSVLISSEGDIAKGSGRSIKGFNLFEAFENCKNLLVRFGGHELAAGLSIETSKINDFRKLINDYAKEKLTEEILTLKIKADCEIDPMKINMNFAKELEIFEPYGMGNPQPIFLIKGLKTTSVTPLTNRKYARLNLEFCGKSFNTLSFEQSYDSLNIGENDLIDIVCTISENIFRNKSSVQLIYKDSTVRGYKEIPFISPDLKNIKINDIPDMDCLRNVYKYFKARKENSVFEVSYRQLANHINSEFTANYPMLKIDICLIILEELGIFKFIETENGISFKMLLTEGKVNIKESNTYLQLINNFNFEK